MTHLERLLRDRPEWAGRLMEGGQITWLEWHFEIDCVQLPPAMQRVLAEMRERDST